MMLLAKIPEKAGGEEGGEGDSDLLSLGSQVCRR
jgi:hypothetical protein